MLYVCIFFFCITSAKSIAINQSIADIIIVICYVLWSVSGNITTNIVISWYYYWIPQLMLPFLLLFWK